MVSDRLATLNSDEKWDVASRKFSMRIPGKLRVAHEIAVLLESMELKSSGRTSQRFSILMLVFIVNMGVIPSNKGARWESLNLAARLT
jgi:hypothetical protein